jgi:hypothetical protein
MNHVRMFNAPTALVVFSENVVLQDCYFRGVSGLVLPDNSLFLNPQGQGIEMMDLRNGKAVRLSKVPEAGKRRDPASPAPTPGKRTALFAAGGIGIAAIVLGAGWLALNVSDDGGSAVPSTEPEVDDPPAVPAIPQPAGGNER